MLNVQGITKNKDLILESFKGVEAKRITKMPIIVIYERPKDYPNNYVARLFDFQKPTKMIVLKNSLEEIRETIPKAMIKIGRSVTDEKTIVESYI